MMPSTLVRLLAALPLLIALTTPARGITFLETMGAPHTRHPYLARVLPVGPASAYFNPGMLLDHPNSVLIGPFVHIERLRVRLDQRPAGVDVPLLARDALSGADPALPAISGLTRPTAELGRPRAGEDVTRAVFAVGQGTSTVLIPDRLALGFYLLLVGDAFNPQQARFADEREQAFSNALGFELLGDRLRTVGFSFGVAGRPWDFLTLGAGISLGFASETRVAGVLDTRSADDLVMRVTNSLHMRLQPQFSATVEPFEGLAVSATLHLPYANLTRGKGTLLLRDAEGDVTFESGLAARHADLPWRVGFGAAYTRPAENSLGWGVGAQAVCTEWSTYRDRMNERARGWSDTFTLSAGGELLWRVHAWALNLLWAPSPVPPQRGRTNYVDNPRLGFALGWEGSFPVGPLTLLAGVNLNFQWLQPVAVKKSLSARHPVVDELPNDAVGADGQPLAEAEGLQTNNPGYPGFQSDGWLMGAGATVRVLF